MAASRKKKVSSQTVAAGLPARTNVVPTTSTSKLQFQPNTNRGVEGVESNDPLVGQKAYTLVKPTSSSLPTGPLVDNKLPINSTGVMNQAAPVTASSAQMVDTASMTKEEKKAYKKVVKQVKAAEKKQLAYVKNSQQLEVKALKEEMKAAGLSASEISAAVAAEKAANKTEYAEAKGLLKPDGPQILPKMTTLPSTFDPSSGYGQNVANRLNSAIGLQQKYNISPSQAIEDGYTGIPLTRLDTALKNYNETGSFGKGPAGKSLDRLMSWGDNENLSLEQIARNGNVKSVKPVKGQEGVFRVRLGDSSGDNQNYTTQFFKQNPDGSFKPTALDKYFYEAPENGGLFGNDILNTLAIAAAAYFGGPMVATALGGGTAGAVGAGALMGGVVAPSIMSGDLTFDATGALIGGAGAGLFSYGGSEGWFDPIKNAWSDFSGNVYDSYDSLTNAVGGGEPLGSGISTPGGSVGAGLDGALGSGIGTPGTSTLPDGLLGSGVSGGVSFPDFAGAGVVIPEYSGGGGSTTTTPSGVSGEPLGSGIRPPTTTTPAAGLDGAAGSGISAPTTTTPAPGLDGALGSGVTGGLFTASDLTSAFPGAFPTIDSANQFLSGAGMPGGVPASSGGGLLESLGNAIGVNPGTLGSLLGTGATALGSYLNAQQAQESAETLANAQIQAAKIAAEAARFKPVGVTTRFGQSQFGFDDKGNLTSAGYNLSPDVKAQQDQLMGISQGLLNQYSGSQQATAPMSEAAQRAMQLGQGYLGTSPQEQAQKYMAEQQALLATGRERDLANLESRLAARGRLGFASGGTSTGMTAANPELEAYYNALRQQDLGLAAQATQGGMDYAKFGAGMVGTGGDLLSSMYRTQSAAYDPYKTALGGASHLEGLGQNAMDLGINIGAKGTASSAQAGQLLAQGMTNAAQTMQPANAYSGWGSLLTGLGNTVTGQYGQPQQQPYSFNPFTGQPL